MFFFSPSDCRVQMTPSFFQKKTKISELINNCVSILGVRVENALKCVNNPTFGLEVLEIACCVHLKNINLFGLKHVP